MNDWQNRIAWSAVPADKRASVKLIWSWDFGFLVERLSHQRLMPEGIITQAIEEYRKFMTLGLLRDHLDMFSGEVDEVWHAHILFTRQYAEFCHAVYGRFIHHDPVLPREAEHLAEHAKEDREKFFRAYREVFGEPSILW